jgi:hypothetical protein
MFIISHRGNLNGPDPTTENTHAQILKVLDLGLDVEVDVWADNGHLYLGHDGPVESVSYTLLSNPKVWVHAKNVEALYWLSSGAAHVFFHQTDDVVLTSKGFLWTYPGKPLFDTSICVLPEIHNRVGGCGICTDFPYRYIQR